ncbi:MAG: hypothetical protein V1773_09650 [bacterium]
MMSNKNPITPVFLLFLLITTVLIFLNYITADINIGPFQIKKVDLFSDLRPEETDSLLANYKPQVDNDKIEDRDLDELLAKLTIPIEDFGNSGLSCFYNALTGFQPGDKLRIAYYGDSIIEGDLFSQDLRNYIQKRFGGAGVGFVPITNNNSGIRNTIQHQYSSNFINYSILKKKPQGIYFGINGFVYLTDTTSAYNDSLHSNTDNYWVEYEQPNKTKIFNSVRIFYSTLSDSAYCTYSVNGLEYNELLLPKSIWVKEVRIDNINSDKIKVNFSKHLMLYGVSFEDNQGVFVDNFSIRGHSGLQLTRIPQTMLECFNSFMNYKLIILQFGANVITEETKDYSWYKEGMVKVIKHFQSAFPNTSILLISSSDRSKKDIKGFKTLPCLTKLIDAQRNAAKSTNIAFWNIYKAMGGNNSMPLWVEEKLASPDYTHFNFAGAKILSGKLTKSLFLKL